MSKKQKIITALVVFILTLFNGIIIFSNNNNIYLSIQNIIKYEISVLLTYIFSYFLYVRMKNKQNIVTTFLIIYIVIGLFYLFLFPINSLVDETNHFYRSYEISNGHLISSKHKIKNGYLGVTYVTKNVKTVAEVIGRYKYNGEILTLKENKHQSKKEVELTNISMYSFVCYLPQAIGVLIGRILNLPILFWCYLARLCNFIMFIFLLKFSLNNIPYKKSTLMFIALLPMAMQSAVSMSADCMTLGASFALISYVLKLTESKEKINKKDCYILMILSLLIALSKIVYLPLCFITILIPSSKFNNKKEKIKILGFILLIVTILNLVWLSIASQFLASLNNSGMQLKYIITHPFYYLYVIFNTILTKTDLYTRMMIGEALGNMEVIVSNNYINLDILLAILLILFDNKKKIDIRTKIILSIIYSMITLLMFTSLYLDWTTYESETVLGIQGRYFLPIFFLVFMIINTKKVELKDNKIFNNFYLLLLLLIENFYVLGYMSIYFGFIYK